MAKVNALIEIKQYIPRQKHVFGTRILVNKKWLILST